MQKVYTKSAKETQDFARKLSKKYKSGGIIALYGELGAGKTTFAQGFARGLGINNKITSPTFLITRQYPVPGQRNFFYHIDLYRLENIDLKSSGLEEILEDPTNIILIEWADKINANLSGKTRKVSLKRIEEGIHSIELTN